MMDDQATADFETFLREQAEATAVGAAEKALERLSVDEDDGVKVGKRAQNAKNANTRASSLQHTSSAQAHGVSS